MKKSISLLALASILVAGTAYVEYGLQRLQRTERSLAEQYADLDSRVETLRATLSSPETKRVEQEVTALEQELAWAKSCIANDAINEDIRLTLEATCLTCCSVSPLARSTAA